MRKFIFLFLIFLGLASAGRVLAQEKIDNFDVEIKINADASVNVREFIRYDFDGLNKHGIFRDIPIKYAARGGNYNLSISDISVTDETGVPYQFTKSYPGSNIQIKIGDADKFVTDQKTYIINYKIKRAINYFDDHDELYWNATGNQWAVPIEGSSAKVILPAPISKTQIQATCFTGAFGNQSSCFGIDYEYETGDMVYAINFSHPEILSPNQGLTIVAGWPKGIVAQPSALQNVFDTVKDNWILVLPLITFIIMFYLWYTRGRDPKGRGTIYAQYEAPDNLTPAEIGTLIDEKVDQKDISSEIIYLATKGYLKITRIENKEAIFKSEDYFLKKLKQPSGLPEFDMTLIKDIFVAQGIESIKLSELKDKFYKHIPFIKRDIYNSLVKKGYFPENPEKIKLKFILFDVVAIILLIMGVGLFTGGNWGTIQIFSILVSGFIILIFGLAMPVKTKKGVEAKENILGLKEYLEVAEKDRIKFHNAPEKNPEHFEKLLPYAMVLGVEREWAKQFEGIYNQQPSWYNDPSGGTFNSLILISSLNNFSHSANSVLASTPRSAAGGGSGFGGGGFSGGGFGGGGGGSW